MTNDTVLQRAGEKKCLTSSIRQGQNKRLGQIYWMIIDGYD